MCTWTEIDCALGAAVLKLLGILAMIYLLLALMQVVLYPLFWLFGYKVWILSNDSQCKSTPFVESLSQEELERRNCILTSIVLLILVQLPANSCDCP